MMLVIKLIDAPGVSGGKALALCTEDGKMFGMQTECIVSSRIDDLVSVTATFYVDGKDIRLDP